MMTEAKTQVWEEFGEAMEIDFQSAPKKFWQTTWQLRKGKAEPHPHGFWCGSGVVDLN